MPPITHNKHIHAYDDFGLSRLDRDVRMHRRWRGECLKCTFQDESSAARPREEEREGEERREEKRREEKRREEKRREEKRREEKRKGE